MDGLLKNCRIQNQLLRECLAEFLGVYVLIVSKATRRMFKKKKKIIISIKSLNAADDPEISNVFTQILRRFVDPQNGKLRTLSPKEDRKRESWWRRHNLKQCSHISNRGGH